MPETRSTLDWSQILDRVDYDLVSKYSGVLDAIEQAKDKYSALWRNIEALITCLIRTKAELDQVTALRQKELTKYSTTRTFRKANSGFEQGLGSLATANEYMIHSNSV